MTRRRNDFLQDREVITYKHVQVTADTTLEIYITPSDRPLVIDRVLYTNDGALAADDTNYVIIKLLNGASTVAASWSTKLTGGNGALVAGTLNTLVLSSTPSDLNPVAGTKLKLFLDATGTPTVPTGTIRVEGRLL
jgi:RNase P/RNase MRP subunit p29